MSDLAPDVPLDQVEWRVQGTPANGSVSVVPYLDAPTVSDLLDDWVGPFGWRDHYEPAGKEGVMWCHLSVKDGDEWITKEDLGTASAMEADKGLVSDAFKRVAMRKWGVGRNVFDLPVLRIRKFRQYQRNGKDQAALTGESAVEIKERLTALGFADAAAQTRVAADEVSDSEGGAGPDPKQDVPPSDTRSHEQLLDELGMVIVEAREVGVSGDFDATRDYAAESVVNAQAAISKLRKAIAAKGAAA